MPDSKKEDLSGLEGVEDLSGLEGIETGPGETGGHGDAFVPAHDYLKEAGETLSDAAVGAAGGLTAMHDDEIWGALNHVAHAFGVPGAKPYEQARDEARARQHKAWERSPGATASGMLLGGAGLTAATGGLGAAAEAGELGEAGTTLAQMAKLMPVARATVPTAIAGAGASEAKTANEVANDAGISGASAPIINKAVQVVRAPIKAGAERLGRQLTKRAAMSRAASTGMSAAEVAKAGGAERVAGDLREQGVFKPSLGVVPPNKADIAERAGAAVEARGAERRAIEDRMRAAGVRVQGGPIASALERRANEIPLGPLEEQSAALAQTQPMLPPRPSEHVPMPAPDQLRPPRLEIRKGVRGISGMNGAGRGQQMPDAEYPIMPRAGTVRPNAPTQPAPPPEPLLDTPRPSAPPAPIEDPASAPLQNVLRDEAKLLRPRDLTFDQASHRRAFWGHRGKFGTDSPQAAVRQDIHGEINSAMERAANEAEPGAGTAWRNAGAKARTAITARDAATNALQGEAGRPVPGTFSRVVDALTGGRATSIHAQLQELGASAANAPNTAVGRILRAATRGGTVSRSAAQGLARVQAADDPQQQAQEHYLESMTNPEYRALTTPSK